jgi:uncharacterized protein
VAGVFRINGISYLRIPVNDPLRAAAFYRTVFDWRVDADRADPSFEDGTGHVIGHFVTGQAVSGEDGIRPYVFVERIDETLDAAVANGGEVVTPPYPGATSPSPSSAIRRETQWACGNVPRGLGREACEMTPGTFFLVVESTVRRSRSGIRARRRASASG